MKKILNKMQTNVSMAIYKILFVSLLLFFTGKGWGQIYQHNFGTTTITTCPYTVAPSILDANLSNSSWTNSKGAWTSYSGSSGQAIALSNSSGTPTITLTFNVASGHSLSLTTFSFWQQRSNTGAQNWSMTVNSIAVGSGTVPTTGTNTGNLTPTNSISGLTGTITVVISLSGASGTGTYRLDDFTLNGSVTASCTPISTLPWTENFDGLSTVGTTYFPSCWLKENGDWTSGNAASQSYNDPRSTPNYIYDAYSATNEYIWTPGFSLTASTSYNFSFWFVGDGSAGWTGDVFYNTAQSSTGGSIQQLGSSFITSGTTSSTSYTQVTRTFTPTTSGTYYFAIRVNATITPWYLGFDDFSLTSSACTTPITQATGVTYSALCSTTATIGWTRGNGSGCTVFMYQGNSGTAAPVDGTTYTANTTFGSGTQIGSSGWYCLYNGTGTNVSITGLAANTTYRVQVCEYNCSGTNTKYNSTNSTNNPNNTTTTSIPCYCNAGATTCDEYISKVVVGTINNSTNCTTGGYADYTAQSTTMNIGTGYPITVTNGTGYSSDQCGIWVDWNKDGDFTDANEAITVSGTAGIGPYTATISPPTGAAIGNTRMRIRITYTGTLDPCGTTAYGEVEDYTINVQSGSCVTPGAPASVLGTATGQTTANLSWVAGSPAGSATVTYYWVVGTSPSVTYGSGIDQGTTVNTSVTSSALTCNTTYYLRVYAFTSCNNTSSAYSTSSSFITSACPVVPTNDQCSGAIVVTCGSSTPGTTVGATTTNDPTATCGVTITSPGVWYSFAGTGQNITVSLCGSALPTSLNVYSGSCASLTCIGGDEGNYTACGDNNASYTFTSAVGTTYYFFIHGIGIATGTFTLNVSCVSVTLPNCPILTTPANGATNVGTPASLNWTAPSGGGAVSYYKLYFGTDNPPTNIMNGTNIGNVLTYSPTMSGGITYYWKVTAVNGAGESSGCTTRSFTTSSITDLIVDNTSFTPTQLVQNYLISGCLEAQNIKFTGNSLQIGYFQGGNSTVGYNEGLVLSSGNAKDAEGPNTSVKNSTDYGGAGDAAIDAIVSPHKSYDAAVLEFDFKPSSNNVSFRYTFASEEYNEFVNSAYNDAFGFFLTGGPQGYANTNIALIPGTSTPVTINNVNDGYKAATTVGTAALATGPCTNCAYYRDNADGHMNIECDGLTTVLTATATVTACQWYHIKLVVADVNDRIYDSWVFLEANSFSSGSGVAMNVSNPTGTKNSYEGCTSEITFTRVDSTDTSIPLTINYSMSGTATSGVDYIAPQNPVTIPAGDTSIVIPLNTINDGVTEGTETIIFAVTGGGCPCNPIILHDTIYLHDFVGVSGYIQEPSQTICQGQPITLHGIVTTGNYYLCTWLTGTTFISHNNTITVTPLTTTTYNFIVIDSCGNSFTKNVIITVDPPVSPPASATVNHGYFCLGDYSTITLSATGGSGATLNWFTGSCGGTAIGTGNNLTITAPVITTTYYAAWSNVGCGLSNCTSVTVTVNPLPIANAGIDDTIWNGHSDTLNGSASGGTGNYAYSWSPPGFLVNPNIADPITIGLDSSQIFTLLVTDPTTGCTSTDQVTIYIKGGPIHVISVTISPNVICFKDTAQLLAVPSGGNPATYTFSWSASPSSVFADSVRNPYVSPDTTTVYTIILSDGSTSDTSSVTLIVNPLPITYNIIGTGSYCNNITGIPVCLSGSETGIDYQLLFNGTNIGSPVAGTGSSICFGDQPAGNYIIIATNTATGCKNTMAGSVTVTVNPIPTAYTVSTLGNGQYCSSAPGVTIELSGSEVGVNYELFVNGVTTGIISPGTGSAIDFANQPAGTYTIVATNTTTGCINTMNGSATIIVNPLPVAYNVSTMGNGQYCSSSPGVTVILSGSEVGINYELFVNGVSTGIIAAGTGAAIDFANQPAGTYTVVATNTITGCTNTMSGSATIIVNPTPVAYNVSTSGNGQYCSSSPGVTIELSGSEVGVNYELFIGGVSTGIIIPGTGSAIDFANQPAGVYIIIATDTVTGCTNTMNGSATITVNPIPIAYTISTLGSGEYCASSPGVTVEISGSEVDVNYELFVGGVSTGIIIPGTGAAIDFVNQPAGIYTVIATNVITGCTNTMNGSATIIVHPTPIAYNVSTLGSGDYCSSSPGVTVVLSSSEVGVNYELFVNGVTTGIIAPGTGSAINFANQPAGIYTVIATDTVTGCTNTMNGSATIIIHPTPIAYNVSTLGSGDYCASSPGVTIVLSNSETGVNYELYVNGAPTAIIIPGTGAAINFANQPAGTYTIVATNATTGCTNTMNGSAIIIVHPVPIANAGADIAICIGSETTLNCSSGTQYSYSWNPLTGLSSSTISNPVASPTATTLYTVMITDNNGCTATDDVLITVNSIPVVSLSSSLPGNIGYLGSDIVFTASPSNYDSYQFFVNGGAQTGSGYSYETSSLAGPQTVYVIAENNNCYSVSDTLFIDVKPISNAFTPNNDGVNDRFLTGLHIKIFNRWGELIYEGTDGWDGKFNGTLVSAGTYFYVINITDKEQNSTELKGSVTLVIKN